MPVWLFAFLIIWSDWFHNLAAPMEKLTFLIFILASSISYLIDPGLSLIMFGSWFSLFFSNFIGYVSAFFISKSKRSHSIMAAL